jgi:hypothetical protein
MQIFKNAQIIKIRRQTSKRKDVFTAKFSPVFKVSMETGCISAKQGSLGLITKQTNSLFSH